MCHPCTRTRDGASDEPTSVPLRPGPLSNKTRSHRPATQPITLQQASTLLTEQPSIRYLGLDVDTAWTFSEHLKKQEDALSTPPESDTPTQSYLLGRLPCSHETTSRHVSPARLSVWSLGVRTALQRTLLQTANLTSYLLAIYRSGSILITGAHRTTPTSSLLTLAGMRPPEMDLLDRITTYRHLPVHGMQKTKQTYPTPSQQYHGTMKQIISQEWIPPVNLLPPPACLAENPRGCGARLVSGRRPQRVESFPRESLFA